MTPQTHNHVFWYLTIFAFGSDHFGSTSGAFGQLGEQDRWAGTRFWQVRCLERVFFVSSGSSGRRTGRLALGFDGFGRFGGWMCAEQ